MESKIIAILLLIITTIIISFSVIYRKKVGLISFIMTLVWGIQIIIVFLVSDTSIMTLKGIVWIITAIIVFNIGSLFGVEYVNRKSKRLKYVYKYKIKENICEKILIISIIIGCMFSIISLKNTGFSIKSLFDITQLLEINTKAAELRYSNKTITSVLQQIVLCFVYFSALLGGFYNNFAKNKKGKYISLMSIIPGILNLLTTNGKSGFISSFMLFITGYLVSASMIQNMFIKINIKNLFYVVLSGIISIFLLIYSMILRIGTINLQTFNIVKNKFISYALGHLPAFDYWISNIEKNHIYYLGAKTFYAISNILGISEKKQGIYQDFYNNGIWKTNVYTAFRPLIEDWGVIGSLIVLFLVSLFLGLSYKLLEINRLSIVGICSILAGSFYIFYSFITTPWAYTTLILPFIFMFMVLKVILKKERIFECEKL